MRFPALFCALLAVALSLPVAADETRLTADYAHQGQQDWGMLKQYCSKCHNTSDWAGGVAFDTMNPAEVPSNAGVWEAAVRKLSGGLMPPPGNPHPPQKQVDGFVGWLQRYLDAADKAGVEPLAGHVALQRLDRTQYGEEVQRLLGITVDVADLLPPETQVGGFDNISAGLSVSPSFLSQYVRAARVVSHLAVGEPAPRVSTTLFPAPRTDQDSYQNGMPLGSRGGETFTYNFPVDGEYHFTITDLDLGLYTWSVESRNTLVLLVDGKEAFRGDLGGLKDLELVDRGGAPGRAKIMARFADIPVHVAAGQRKVTVTFVLRSQAETDFDVGSGAFTSRLRSARLLGGVQVAGPYGTTQLSETPSRRQIFICEPKTPEEQRPCAEKIAEHLAQRAFRRPVTPEDLNRLMPFYDAGSKEGGFNAGIEQVVAAVLVSPAFLYRAILPSLDANDGKLHALSNLELASRLSFFLWNQGPDDELLRVAMDGELTQPKVLDEQARRMLADPRAASLVNDFAVHWLDLDKIDSVVPEQKLFPDYSPGLRDDFMTEAKLFISSIFLKDQNVLGLLDANYTFLNERLADHYGIDSVHGSQFRRVSLQDHPERWGLLGKAAMLMETSYADRTSPVRRGAWILDKLMGTPPAQPPPGINMNLDQPPGLKPVTVRARLAQHRANPSCGQCHGVIDPYGLALENFNATGAWRTFDHVADENIDPASELPNGQKLSGAQDLRKVLVSQPDRFVTALTEKLMMYALGRKLDYYDMPQVRAIGYAAHQDDYRFSAIILGIVNSDDFRMQAVPHAPAAAAVKVADNTVRSH